VRDARILHRLGDVVVVVDRRAMIFEGLAQGGKELHLGKGLLLRPWARASSPSAEHAPEVENERIACAIGQPCCGMTASALLHVEHDVALHDAQAVLVEAAEFIASDY